MYVGGTLTPRVWCPKCHMPLCAWMSASTSSGNDSRAAWKVWMESGLISNGGMGEGIPVGSCMGGWAGSVGLGEGNGGGDGGGEGGKEWMWCWCVW